MNIKSKYIHHQIKHVFCGLDGTLFGSSLTISPIVVKAINSLPNTIGFSICTARGAKEAFSLIDKLKLYAPQIVENGATVIMPSGTILRQYCLSEKEAFEIIRLLSHYSIWKKSA